MGPNNPPMPSHLGCRHPRFIRGSRFLTQGRLSPVGLPQPPGLGGVSGVDCSWREVGCVRGVGNEGSVVEVWGYLWEGNGVKGGWPDWHKWGPSPLNSTRQHWHFLKLTCDMGPIDRREIINGNYSTCDIGDPHQGPHEWSCGCRVGLLGLKGEQKKIFFCFLFFWDKGDI